MKYLIPGFIARFADRLRFPSLFFLTAGVFIIDLLIPDIIPLADEILFGLGTLVLARWKKRKISELPSKDSQGGNRVDAPL